METSVRQQPAPTKCPHCGDDTGTCVTLRCLKCELLLCSRQVTPVSADSPLYPYKHHLHGHTCGPVQPGLLPGGAT